MFNGYENLKDCLLCSMGVVIKFESFNHWDERVIKSSKKGCLGTKQQSLKIRIS